MPLNISAYRDPGKDEPSEDLCAWCLNGEGKCSLPGPRPGEAPLSGEYQSIFSESAMSACWKASTGG